MVDKYTSNDFYEHEHGSKQQLCAKVYGILSAQLLMTCCIVSIMLCYEQFILSFSEKAIHSSIGVFSMLSMGVLLALQAYKHDHTLSSCLLFVFTCIQSYLVGIVCVIVQYQGYGHLIAQSATITLIIFLSLSLFTVQSNINFSFLGQALFVCLCGLVLWGFTGILFGFTLHIYYSYCGVILFSLFIVYDTWELMNKHYHYIDIVVGLYLDMINLFIHILQILIEQEKNKRTKKRKDDDDD